MTAQTVPTGRAVERALKFTHQVTPAQAKERLVTLEKVVQRIRSDKDNLLPIEVAAAPLLDESIDKIMDEYLAMKSIANSNLKYDIFDLQPLTWRNTHGFPQLVPFNLYNPNFHMTVTFRWDASKLARAIEPNLPQELAGYYDDVFERLDQRARRNQATISLTTQFKGMLPEDVKAKIAEADGKLRYLHMVAEVENWGVRETAVPRPGDPLVIGYDGACWRLVADFDLTDLEKSIKDRYTIPVRD